MNSEAQIHPKYRADIDGLRAIAVLSVLGFHAFPQWIHGGLVGVDVFFVISGYLISNIIFSNLNRGNFSFSDFYSRRIRRIFPALLLIFAFSYGLGWYSLVPYEFKQLGDHIASGAAFISNFLLRREAGYFDTAAELKPLLHLWSLGIEEQFYIVFPLGLFLIYRFRLNPLPIVLLCTIFSFGLNIAKIQSDPIRVFYLPYSRFWELLIGSLLAYCSLYRVEFSFRQQTACEHSSTIANAVLNNVASCLGFAMIIAAAAAVTKQSSFPGWWALLPTLGATLILFAGPKAWLNRAILSHPILIWFGLISYPLYLWHWPILSFALLIGGEPLSFEMRFALVLASIALAWLTYRFVEKPFRHSGGNKAKVATLCAFMAVAGGAGVVTKKQGGFLFRFPPEIRELIDIPESSANEWRRHRCFFGPEDLESTFGAECSDFSSKEPLILVWGDSHAAALYPGLRAFGDSHHFRIAQFTASNCPPLLNPGLPANVRCGALNAQILGKIKELKPSFVVLSGNWTLYNDWPTLEKTIQSLRRQGSSRILIVGPSPEWKADLPKLVWRYWKKDFRHQATPLYMSDGLKAETPALDKRLRDFSERMGAGADYISALDKMCNTSGCLTRIGNKISSVDTGHFTPIASDFFIRSFADYFLTGSATALRN